MVATLFNFTLFIIILYRAAKKPVVEMVAQRHQAIRDAVATNRKRLEEARASYEEYSSKLRVVETEVAAIRQQVRTEAEATRLRIQAAAKTMAASVVSDAQAGAKNVFEDLRRDLLRQLAEQVMTKAEAGVRKNLTGDLKAKIRQEFSSEMEGAR